MTAASMRDHGGMDHREAWDAIPWLVNGALAPPEAGRLRAHLGGCRDCAAELADQRRLAAAVAAIERPVPEEAASWRALEARLPPERAPRRPGLGGLLGGLRASGRRLLGGAALAGGLAAAALVAAVVLWSPAGEFETLTETGATGPAAGPAAGPEAATVELRAMPAPGTDPERLRAAFEAAGAVGVEGPSETGLLRVRVPSAERDAALAALRADPAFLVVAGDR